VPSSPARRITVAVLVTITAVVALFLTTTWGLAAVSQARTPDDSGVAALPLAVDNAPASLGTTDEYGPLGTVSMVFAGTSVEDGLIGEVARPWLAIAARTGDYRAISAPDLPAPAPGAIALSDGGDLLAWATHDGVVVYDTETGDARSVPLDDASHVGSFSPDGSMLAVGAGGLAVLDLGSGEVVAEAEGTDPGVVHRAAWRGDGSAVDYTDGADLVSVPVDGSAAVRQPSPFEDDVRIIWAPTGEQVVALQDDADGVPRLFSAPAHQDGRLGEAAQVDTSGVAIHRMLGFSGDTTVAISAYLLESGNVERILDVKLGGGSVVDLTALPTGGENWRGSATLVASGEALRAGSVDFGARQWPWSYRSRLVGCVLVGIFGLGMWLTRRRHDLRRARHPRAGRATRSRV